MTQINDIQLGYMTENKKIFCAETGREYEGCCVTLMALSDAAASDEGAEIQFYVQEERYVAMTGMTGRDDGCKTCLTMNWPRPMMIFFCIFQFRQKYTLESTATGDECQIAWLGFYS